MANQFLYSNFFITELVSGIQASDVTFQIPAADALLYPIFSSGYYAPMFLWDGSNPPEIVWATANPQSGVITCLRGQESTAAFAWGAGTQVRSSITAAVLNAALAAYNSGLVLVANYLPLTGGTLTGPLTLSGLPTTSLMAATKGYVDSSISGLLPLAGGTMSGNINMNSNRILALPAPITGGEPATKTYVDTDFTLVSNISADRSGQLLTTGTGAAYTITSNTGYGPVLADGLRISARVHATNQAAPTLALDGTAAVAIRSKTGTALPPGRLPLGSIWDLEYRLAGPEWLLTSEGRLPTLGTTGGPAAYAVSTGMSLASYQDGLEFDIQLNAASSGAMTLNADTLGAIPLRPSSGVEYVSGAFAQYNILPVRYNATTGEFIVKGAPPPPLGTNNLSYSDLTNVGLTVAENANIMTVALKTLSGADASASNPINIPFADPAGGGLPVWRQVTGALSVATIIGATFGVGNNTPFRVWVAIFDNAGTPQLALSIRGLLAAGACNIFPIDEASPQNTVAMSGGSTSGGVWYTGAGITLASKAFRILGSLDFVSGLATAGSYNAVPVIHLFGAGSKRPGDEIQRAFNVSSAVNSGATNLPNDDTIPQNTEGDQYMSQAITPSSQINLLDIEHVGNYATGATAYVGVALFQDATANALAATQNSANVTTTYSIPLRYFMQAATVSATTFKIRAGSTGGATTTFNGLATARKFGGVLSSLLSVKEIMF